MAFLPLEKRTVIRNRDVPMHPAIAAAAPPPGVGVFAAMDLVLFYVFWEIMLVPMVLIIGIWGSKRRLYAAVSIHPVQLAVVVAAATAARFERCNHRAKIGDLLLEPGVAVAIITPLGLVTSGAVAVAVALVS